MVKGVARVYFFTEDEFHHVNCMIVRIWEVKRVACYARAETFTEAVASATSMIATPLVVHALWCMQLLLMLTCSLYTVRNDPCKHHL